MPDAALFGVLGLESASGDGERSVENFRFLGNVSSPALTDAFNS